MSEPIDLGRFTMEEVRAFWDRMVAHSPLERGPEGVQHVIFRLHRSLFALEASYCRGVFPFRPPSPLPVLPAHILGVSSIRGRPVSVTDISVFFGLKATSNAGHMLIVHSGEEETALVSDWVETLTELDVTAAQPPPSRWVGMRTGLVTGVLDYKGDMLVLLNAERCIRAAEAT